jgi:hypothetical protein
MLAIEIIKKAGFNVVPADFAYTGSIKNKAHSFIFYKFQKKLVTVQDAFRNGKLTKEDVEKIRFMLKRAEKDINSHLKQNKKKFPFSEKLKISDVAPHKIVPLASKVFENLAVFIDLKTGKLFLFDPLILNSDYRMGLFG